MIYKFDAENVTRSIAIKLVRELEAKGVVVEYANVGQVFSNEMVMIVTCNEEMAKQIRDDIWKVNHGLFCDMSTITQDQLDSYL